MQFKDIIGQQKVKNQLIQTVKNNRISHTQLFLGADGVGALPLAIAYAQYINCASPSDTDSCGVCPSCVKYSKFIHPDLHFTFPIIIKDKKSTSNDYMEEWRKALIDMPYLSELEWIQCIDEELKKQANITAEECRSIIKKLSLKSYEAEYKTAIIWLPEYLRQEGNILLKLLEEPPPKTLIILVAKDIDKVIATILSRTQILRIPNLHDDEISSYLIEKLEVEAVVASSVARISEGSIIRAQAIVNSGDADYFELFTSWMRLCYNTRSELYKINAWVDNASGMGREFLKSFLGYSLYMFRASFIHTYGANELISLSENEKTFIINFSKVITKENIVPIVNVVNKNAAYIERNADLKITFLNLSLYIGRLLNRNYSA